MQITINLDPVTKKNSGRIITAGGRFRLLPSATYARYQADAAEYLLPARPPAPIDYPVQVKCLFYRRTRRRGDLTNYLECIDDCLVYYGILIDDNCNVIISHDGSRVLYDKANPRTEITITPMGGATMGL